MTDIATMRTALSDAVDSVAGLRSTAYVTDAVNSAQAMIVRTTVDFDLTMGRGADTYHFTVTIYAPRTAATQSQQFLDTLADPSGATSLRTVLCTDAVATAAGVDYVKVVSCSEVKVATIGTIEYLTEDFTIEVVA